MSEYSIIIGKFSPIHNGHLELIKKAFETSENLIFLVGSASNAISIETPWDFEQRRKMINAVMIDRFPNHLTKYVVAPINDYLYNRNKWITNVQETVSAITNKSQSISIIASYDGKDSQYIKWLKWNVVSIPKSQVSSNEIRSFIYKKCVDWYKYVPVEVKDIIINELYREDSPTYNEEKANKLFDEFNFITSYKKSWEIAPYPPTFVTADAIVIQSGHVLVIERKMNPGKGLFAVPGGFVDQKEYVFDAAVRELYEETKIDVPSIIIEKSCIEEKMFDYPFRSLRGRTITHAYLFKLDDHKPLPEIKGSDDALRAFWMPFSEFYKNESRFFDDHFHMIDYFIGRGE